jgi:hypothetical protein
MQEREFKNNPKLLKELLPTRELSPIKIIFLSKGIMNLLLLLKDISDDW